jgi:hypothetical protein
MKERSRKSIERKGIPTLEIACDAILLVKKGTTEVLVG